MKQQAVGQTGQRVVVGQMIEPRLINTQSLLCSDPFGDVGNGPDETADFPGIVGLRGRLPENPHITAIEPAKPILHLKAGLPCDRLRPLLSYTLPVIGVKSLGPARSHGSLGRDSNQFRPFFVDIKASTCGVGVEDSDG